MTEFRKIKARGHTHTPMSRCGASAIHYNIKRNLYSPAVQVTTNPFTIYNTTATTTNRYNSELDMKCGMK